MGPLGGYEAVEDPWWGFLRLTVRPAHWIQVGVSRAALAGGRFEGGSVAFDPVTYPLDEGSLSAADVLRILVAKPTDYDNQLAALDVRVSAAGIVAPLLAYAEFGVEDTDRSWGDPALLAGVLWAPAFSVPLALRYEYVAFGRGARLCGWCDTLPAYWYQHVRFQNGWRVGDRLLGHPLGGYGRQHSLAATAWSRDARMLAALEAAAIRRERWNLLETAQPGSAWRVDAAAAWRPGRHAELSVAWRSERGEGWSVER